MSNVVTTFVRFAPRGIAAEHADIAAISRMFAQQRRRAGDVFWLKRKTQNGGGVGKLEYASCRRVL